MPIYEYRCAACGHKTEALQKLSDPPLTTCPACGKPELAKLVSAAGFQLKGSGWYVTDFRGSGAAKPSDKPDGAETKPAAETSAKTDAKPAEAKAAKSDAAPASTSASPATGSSASGSSASGSSASGGSGSSA